LQAIKKRKSELVNEARHSVKELKQIEVAAKQNSGRTFREVIGKVEDIFKKYYITKPYYHGGKYNGKAMCTFMTSSQEIMADIQAMILSTPKELRCSNDEVVQYTSRCKTVYKFLIMFLPRQGYHLVPSHHRMLRICVLLLQLP